MGCSREDAVTKLDTDTIFELLANQRRRNILSHLTEHRTPIAMADLAVEVTASETGISPRVSQIEKGEEISVHRSLVHVHVPKLADANVVEYDHDRETVALGANADHLLSLLDIASEVKL